MTVAERMRRVVDAVMEKVVVDDNGCWRYQGFLRQDGYGAYQTKINGKKVNVRVHRATYEDRFGPVPNGLQLDHLCRVRDCCNPEHLEAVTAKVNSLRGVSPASDNAKKTHCVRGHDLSMSRYKAKYRRCDQCTLIGNRKAKAKAAARKLARQRRA